MHRATLPAAPLQGLTAIKVSHAQHIPSADCSAGKTSLQPVTYHVLSKVRAQRCSPRRQARRSAGLFFVKELRVHSCIFFRSPEKSSANPCEGKNHIRKRSERSA